MSQTDDQDDAALFRAAIGNVKPLSPSAEPANQRPRPKPRARMSEHDEADAKNEFTRLLRESTPLLEAGDIASHRRDHVPPRLLQRLKRGQFSVQDELDLHGASAAQAEAMLRQFLLEAHAHDYGCVRIIHGKGRKADVLRLRSDVLAFHSAPPAQGGTGAVLVLLAQN
jgi:DNA-nicking Smr family endonuclease